MSVFQNVSAFLGRNGFPIGGPDINSVIAGLLYDMQQGLDVGSGDGPMDARQPMIPTWGMPPEKTPKNTSVIVIDAGGTNFRSCLVSFDGGGNPSISDMEKCSMPGIERELSKEEFFDQIATNLDHLKNKGKRIGFCFSYAMKILPDGDGEVLSFSKEINAKEVIGSKVGACLSDALVKRGWERPERIVLMNDTTAALLAGASRNVPGMKYSSYVGLILGTGMNSAYIEYNPIKKIEEEVSNPPPAQIVVCESGMFDKLPRSSFDIAFDSSTNTPGRYVMEKMCSGAYLGPLATFALKAAAMEGLFSEHVASHLAALPKVDLYDVDQFLSGPYRHDTVLGDVVAPGTQDDYDTMYLILDTMIERSARLTAAVIASCVIKSGKGTYPAKPVCVLCNGTTFFKTHNLRSRIHGYLDKYLSEQRHLYFDIVAMDNDITLGTAIGALSN